MKRLHLRALLRAGTILAVLPGLTGCGITWDNFKLVTTGPEQATGKYDVEKGKNETTAISDFIAQWTGQTGPVGPVVPASQKSAANAKTPVIQKSPLNLAEVISSDKADGIIMAGVVHVDSTCNDLFIHLERWQRDIDTASTEVALMGTAATALLAISGAGVAAAGATGAATALAVGSIENLGKNLLFQLPVGATSTLVKSAQDAHLAASLGTTTSYVGAFRVVQQYAAFCTPVGIEQLVIQEMVRKKIQSEPGNLEKSQDELKRLAAQNELKDTARQLDIDAIKVSEAQLVYALLFLGGRND